MRSRGHSRLRSAAARTEWGLSLPVELRDPDRRPSAHEQLTRSHPAVPAPWRLPSPSGPPPYRLELADLLEPAELEAIKRSGTLRFHCVGDTGGLRDPLPQRAVAAAMATELAGRDPVRFFYHLGDIVYLHGEAANYESQFVQPYAGYQAPIVAIAGNHDGDRAPGAGEAALQAFARHFCGSGPITGHPRRRSPQQPNVYWTLEHDWMTIIGLYTNVPEGGQIDRRQLGWLTGELRRARRGVTLILAMHHPVYSADAAHGSNLALGATLDRCFGEAGRAPDAVFSAHAHNYQRFGRALGGRQIPYVVAGSGGFHELHPLGHGVPDTPASFTGLPGLTLEAHQHGALGYLTVSAGPDGARAVYSTVAHGRPTAFDSFWIEPAPAS